MVIHLPASVIFFAFLYLAIPSFYNYDKSNIENLLCKNKNIECSIRGKVSYSFYPTPRIKIRDLIINDFLEKKKTLITAANVVIKISLKNLLVKEKHKFRNIQFNKFKVNVDLKNFKEYRIFLTKKINSIPINLANGEIIFFEDENYVAVINNADINLKIYKRLCPY